MLYEWDDFNNLKTLQGQGNHRTYLYTADDERVWTSSYTSADSPDTWTFTLRGLGNEVLTTYEAAGNGAGIVFRDKGGNTEYSLRTHCKV